MRYAVTMKRLNTTRLADLSTEAATTPRRRKNLNLHDGPDAAVHRFCNAIEPDSYIRPHRHPEAQKWELLIALTGTLSVLVFDAAGRVLEREQLSANGPNHVLELPPGTWHTLVAEQTGSVVFEVKKGPYRPTDDKDFAAWAPGEGEPHCTQFLDWFRQAMPGATPPTIHARP